MTNVRSRGQDNGDKRFTILRTTTDILSNALVQAEWCVQDWPEYRDDVGQLRVLVERLVQHALQNGYVAKTRI